MVPRVVASSNPGLRISERLRRNRSLTCETEVGTAAGQFDLLVLKALSLGPMHGYGVSQRIQQLARLAVLLRCDLQT